MSFPQEVKSTLWAIVDSMACHKDSFVKNPGVDFSRDRKLGFVKLLRFFLRMGCGCINHELLKYFSFHPQEIPTASAFIQQRAKLLPDAFRHILTQFNFAFPSTAKFAGKYSLIAADGNQKLVDDLGSILDNLREMMRCDVLDETYCRQTIIGLTHQELRERSHNPQKFFGIKQMLLPDYTMGRDYALLNQLRAAIRETEVAAATAFLTGSKCTRPDIMEELNRLSSALHIMMCMYLAGMYRKEDGRT